MAPTERGAVKCSRGRGAKISLRALTPLQWLLLVKPALLLLGFGVFLASWQVTVTVVLIYVCYKTAQIVVLKAVFESIMARAIEERLPDGAD